MAGAELILEVLPLILDIVSYGYMGKAHLGLLLDLHPISTLPYLIRKLGLLLISVEIANSIFLWLFLMWDEETFQEGLGEGALRGDPRVNPELIQSLVHYFIFLTGLPRSN
mmetsp:Transcript_24433/g.24011  ORF Transcript_24433/g.24011 Transcript_24433/m.24011 type:complete len:111 (-) Transcript_24433:1148-1480(-)